MADGKLPKQRRKDPAAEPLPEDAARDRRRLKRALRKAQAEGLMLGITSMLKPGDVVIDCGANVGKVTALLGATGADVHAFEPDPYCFARLTETFADRPNVTLHNAAVGTASGRIWLGRASNFEDNPEGASVKSTILGGGRGVSDSDGVEVDLIDFPAFLRDLLAQTPEIAFLKLDIEGAELDLLEAMEKDGLFRAIRLTVAETHEKKFKDLRPRFQALRERIGAAFPTTKVNLDWI